jgi:hypothetical protein
METIEPSADWAWILRCWFLDYGFAFLLLQYLSIVWDFVLQKFVPPFGEYEFVGLHFRTKSQVSAGRLLVLELEVGGRKANRYVTNTLKLPREHDQGRCQK